MTRLRDQQQVQSLQDQISKKRKLQQITRKTHAFKSPFEHLTTLPVSTKMHAVKGNGAERSEVDAIVFDSDPLLGSWEILQKKTSRAGRKINVEVICAGASSNCLPISLRSVRKPPKPKVKRQSAARKKSKIESSVKIDDDEEPDEGEDHDDEDDVVGPTYIEDDAEEESEELPSFEDELDDDVDEVDDDDDVDDQSLIEELQEENSDE